MKQQEAGKCDGSEAGEVTVCAGGSNQNSFLQSISTNISTYISAPSRMFDVILGTTSGLNLAKIDLLV